MSAIIFHIDVNSAFLSWSALELLKSGEAVDLREIPAIIGGDTTKRHGVVLAKSIPAKRYGITTGEPIVNAFRKCPSLKLLPPDHALYSQRSHELMDLLSSICPEIEQVSVDECYMDYTPIREFYSSPEAAAHFIKDKVRDTLGFTVNVGISDRKVLAKMASDFKKPDLVHTLYASEIKKKLWPLPVSSLFMCGRSSAETLHNLGITTIGQLANANEQVLLSNLKSHGRLLYEYANGIDASKVVSLKSEAKGIGNSTTLSQDVTEAKEAYRILLALCESVATRLRYANQKATSLCVEIKYSTFQSCSHQMSLPSATDTSQVLYTTSKKLFDELWDHTPIRLLGVRTTKLLNSQEPTQLSIFDYPALSAEPKKSDTENAKKLAALDKALDTIRTKYGEDAVVRGSLL